jgi:gas vesicle protein
MKSNTDSKLLLGLIIGGVIGAAVGYLAASDRKEQILDELNGLVEKARNAFNAMTGTYGESTPETDRQSMETEHETVS